LEELTKNSSREDDTAHPYSGKKASNSPVFKAFKTRSAGSRTPRAAEAFGARFVAQVSHKGAGAGIRDRHVQRDHHLRFM